MYFQKVKFHISGYNLRHTPHILILFLHMVILMYLYIFVQRLLWQQPQLSRKWYIYGFWFFSYLVLYTLEFFNNFLVDERSHQARQFVVPDL